MNTKRRNYLKNFNQNPHEILVGKEARGSMNQNTTLYLTG